TNSRRDDGARGFDRPFDTALAGIRKAFPQEQAYRLELEPPGDAWERAYGRCPLCRAEVFTLTITQRHEHRGAVEVECLSGCNTADVARAVGITRSTTTEGETGNGFVCNTKRLEVLQTNEPL